MRHLCAAIAIIALSIVLLLPPTGGHALPSKGGDPQVNAAAKALRRQAKTTTRAIRARGKAANKEIRRLAKLAKKGRGPGAKPSSPGKGNALSPSDGLALGEAVADEVLALRRGIERDTLDGLQGALSLPELQPFVSAASASSSLPFHLGAGGPGDDFITAIDTEAQAAIQKAVDAFGPLQSELAANEVSVTWVPCPQPKPAGLLNFSDGADLYGPQVVDVFTFPDGRVATQFSFGDDSPGPWTVSLGTSGAPTRLAPPVTASSSILFAEARGNPTGPVRVSLDVETATAGLVPVSAVDSYLRRTISGGGSEPPADFPVTSLRLSHRVDDALFNEPLLRTALLSYSGGELMRLQVEFEHAISKALLFGVEVRWDAAPARIAPKSAVSIPTDDDGADPRAVLTFATREEPTVVFTSAAGGSLPGQFIELSADRDITTFDAGKPDLVMRGTVHVESAQASGKRKIEFTLKLPSELVTRVN